MSARSASTSAKSPSVATKSASSSGWTFSRSSLSSTLKWADWPGERGLGVVVREGDVELGRVADLQAEQVGLEARDEALLAEDERHPLGRPTLERLAVACALERDDRVVAVLRSAILDRGKRRVLVAQLLDHLVDPGVVDGVDLGREIEVLVVAEGDLGSHLDGHLEDERLAFLRLDDVDLGVGQRQDVLLDERVAVGVLDEVLDGVVEDSAGGELPFEERSRRLARAEARDPRSAGEVADGLVDGAASRSVGTSIWRSMVELGPAVLVICIVREV